VNLREPAADGWGSKGRRFKSCQPDSETAGQRPESPLVGGPASLVCSSVCSLGTRVGRAQDFLHGLVSSPRLRRSDCHDDAVSEEELHQRMLAAIGRVAMNSGHASMALQQLAETVTGTGLLYFILRDATLGTQLKQVQTLVEHATTNEWIRHPPLDAEVRDLVLDTLRATKPLVEFRNRVIHDIWAPAPSEDHPDGIRAFRATRWGKEFLESTVGTLHQIAATFFLVACALGAAERALADLEKLDPGQPWRTRGEALRELQGYHGDLASRVTAIRSGGLEGWHWIAS
jgi:hypothetical protein